MKILSRVVIVGILCLGIAHCFDHFITREGDQIKEGPNVFRFISYNVPGMTVVEDPSWHLVDPWEQEDVLKTISQIGGRVIRVYTLSIKNLKNPASMKWHIYGPRKYGEDLFRCLDKMLQLCNVHGIRVIIPFIDRWDWWGGIDAFRAFRHASSFYQDPQVKQDFKDLITDVLNRVNTFTGVKYKDDKAILAWETGNELNCPSAWTAEIAAHIKSVDSNHLVMDGHYGIDINSLRNPNIDIVSNHYYPDSGRSYADRCRMDRKIASGFKAFFVGEFGISNTKMYQDLLDEVIADGTIGALIWSLRPHNKDGGYYKHHEGSTSFYSYHWPGFPENNGYNELAVVNLMKEKAYRIQSRAPPPIPAPETPTMLSTTSVLSLNWRGSVGGRSYDIARALKPEGEWSIVGNNVSDCKQIETEGPLFRDTTAQPGTQYYYRVRAKNEAGTSDWSNVIGPVKA
jgi:hypothetical protein